ncbi:MAG: hydroxyacid dehydrogenase [Pseudomonadota bacterium]
MADIVVSEFMDEAIAREAFAGHDLLFDPTLVDDEARLLREAASAKALIVRNRTQVRGGLLEAAQNLQVVGRLGVGLDNIDLAACKARGVAVRPASGANDLSVAEYVITAALVLLRGAWLSSGDVAGGAWPRGALIGREMSGKTLGLIGFGAIARETGMRAAALGMEVIAHDPFLPAEDPAWRAAKSVELSDLYAAADVVSLHTPLTPETRGLLGADAIARMKTGAIVINAARGGVVDEAALAAALKDGRLGGAALDVFETEPLTEAAGAKFAGLPNLLLTPHIAGVTEESNIRVSRVTAENVLAELAKRG